MYPILVLVSTPPTTLTQKWRCSTLSSSSTHCSTPQSFYSPPQHTTQQTQSPHAFLPNSDASEPFQATYGFYRSLAGVPASGTFRPTEIQLDLPLPPYDSRRGTLGMNLSNNSLCCRRQFAVVASLIHGEISLAMSYHGRQALSTSIIFCLAGL